MSTNPDSSIQFCNANTIGYDPQDIEATLGWMLTALKHRDQEAMDNLFWKVRHQIDALEEDYEQQIQEKAQ